MIVNESRNLRYWMSHVSRWHIRVEKVDAWCMAHCGDCALDMSLSHTPHALDTRVRPHHQQHHRHTLCDCHLEPDGRSLFCNVSTGWRGCIGWFKLQVSFRTRATEYRALLQETTYKHKASFASSLPCIFVLWPWTWWQVSGFVWLFLQESLLWESTACNLMSPQ